jgi:hypothetical protein
VGCACRQRQQFDKGSEHSEKAPMKQSIRGQGMVVHARNTIYLGEGRRS